MENITLTTSYWDGNGKYQSDFDRLFQELVPESGNAETLEGEALRAINYLTHDFFNNGNGNLFDSTEVYDEEDDYHIFELTERAKDSLNTLREFIGHELVDKFEANIIRVECNPSFIQEEINIYNQVMDAVIEKIKNK